jgi:hypothetical protein
MAENENDNLIAVRFAIDSAEEVTPASAPASQQASSSGARRGDAQSRRRKAPSENVVPMSNGRAITPPYQPEGLPPDCPVEPLGVQQGTAYYLDVNRELRELPAREHSRLGVQFLFGRKSFLLEVYWPRTDKEGNVTGWRPEKAAEMLISAASDCKVFDPNERVRGRGAWRGDAGELVLHCGDVIFSGREYFEPGRIGRYVYPSGAAITKPALRAGKQGVECAGQVLLDVFNTWNFKRGELDARLLLGWICAARIGGALDWRPLVWITGSRGTGKSTLHKMIGGLFGSALIQVADATAAGIWQKLGRSTLPVTVDELEAEADDKRAGKVIKLAREAASGALVLRGGADHNAAEFVARSCFMFSSILIPPLLPADRSRMAILELGELDTAKRLPDIGDERMGHLGAELLRRLVDGWDRFPETLTLFREALLADGHSARGADVFGTLLAMADLALHDMDLHSDSAAALAARLAPQGLAEADDDMSDQERCLQHLMTSQIPRDGGGNRKSVAMWVEQASSDDGDDHEWKVANRMLGMYGMKVLRGPMGRKSFAVMNYHVELAKVFDGSHWAGQSGSMGVWVQAFRRLPGAQRSERNERFAAAVGKHTLIPIGLVTSAQDAEERAEAIDMGPLVR